MLAPGLVPPNFKIPQSLAICCRTPGGYWLQSFESECTASAIALDYWRLECPQATATAHGRFGMVPASSTERNPGCSMLSSSVSVAQYRSMEEKKDREGIAEFVRMRFAERYVSPISSGRKHGFAIMAICCLMIEALESFKQGWENTRGNAVYAGRQMRKSELAFHLFFQTNPGFRELVGVEHDFYVGVRCGILHQAETTNGWHIWRKGRPVSYTHLTLPTNREV